jgi:plasmid stabilization system protein ParE
VFPPEKRISLGGIDMPQKAWTDKRERQYEHIKDSYEERGVSNDEAEERAARTVNKERAEAGETKAQKKDRSR